MPHHNDLSGIIGFLYYLVYRASVHKEIEVERVDMEIRVYFPECLKDLLAKRRFIHTLKSPHI